MSRARNWALGIPVVLVVLVVVPSLARRYLIRPGVAPVVSDMYAIGSAQKAYASANGGFYDRLECLAAPADCIPGYPGDSPTLLDPELAGLPDEDGYARFFFPGPRVPEEVSRQTGCSPSSVTSYAVLAVPRKPVEGKSRIFCLDDTGGIRVSPNRPEMPVLKDGRCPGEWDPI